MTDAVAGGSHVLYQDFVVPMGSIPQTTVGSSLFLNNAAGVYSNPATLDWAATLAGLEVHDLRQAPEDVHETMMCLLKTHEDRARLTREVAERLLGKVA